MDTPLRVDKDFFNCEICFNDYDSDAHYPMALPCLHEFCRQCVGKLNQDGKIQCPICKDMYDFVAVKKDFKTISLMEGRVNYGKDNEGENINEPVELCQLCDLHADIVTYCKQCKNFLCRSCQRSHRKQFPGHENVLPDEAIKELKESFRKTESDSEQLMKHSKSVLEIVVKNKQEYGNKKEPLIEKIECSRKELLSKVNEYYDNFIQSLNDDKYSQSLNEEESKLNDGCNKIEQGMHNLRELITSHNSAQFIQSLREKIHERLEKDNATIEETLRSCQIIHIQCELTIETSTQINLTDILRKKYNVSERNVNSYAVFCEYNYLTSKDCRVGEKIKLKDKGQRLRLVNNTLHATTRTQLNIYNGKSIIYQHCDAPDVRSSLPLDANSYIIVDVNQGIYHINDNGQTMAKICAGKFSDIYEYRYKFYALNYEEGDVHVFIRNDSLFSLWKVIELKDFRNSSDSDRICVREDCLFVTSWKNNCLLVYNHAGKLVAEHGKNVTDSRNESVGKLKHPYLCDIDKEGTILVADGSNRRLLLLSPTGRWTVLKLPGVMSSPVDAIVSTHDNTLWVLTNKHLYSLVEGTTSGGKGCSIM